MTAGGEISAGEFSRFGPYLIVRTSGVGEMGRVDLALRTDSEQPGICVLKRMHVDPGVPDQQARFEREARIATRLSHPNIARSFKVEEIDGELCLAQEYVQGIDLARLMAQAGGQGLPTWAAAYVAREIAIALAYAHDFAGEEIVHRDVTPENIMVAFTGDVKLIDFGISRSRVDGTLTSLGTIVGRRAYLPPEAWSGNKVDRRADVFALGVVLWELLAARRLEELDASIWKEQVPDPRGYRSDLPAELAAVVLRAVAPEAAQRYQSAVELRDAIAAFVPADKDPRAELVTLLKFYFNVERAREIVAGQMDEAKDAARRRVSDAGSRSRRLQAWIAATGAVAVLGSVMAIAGWRRGGAASDAVSAPAISKSGGAPSKSIAPPAAAPDMRPSADAETLRTAARASQRRPRDTAGVVRWPEREAAVVATSVPIDRPEEILRSAYELFDDGHVAEAQDCARRAIAAGAGAPGHLLLGSIYLNRGRLADAERELETAVRLNPRDAQASRRLADVRRAREEQGQ
jgi:tetratricopeptide (TPR) repeat protein